MERSIAKIKSNAACLRTAVSCVLLIVSAAKAHGQGAVFPLSASSECASGFSFSEIHSPNSFSTIATGINNAGDVVGFEQLPPDGGLYQGFIYDGLNYSSFRHSEAQNTVLWGVNNAGLMTGYGFTYGLGQVASFVTDGTSFTTVSVPGADYTVPYQITDGGIVVGDYGMGGTPHGFIFDGTTYFSVDVPGALHTHLYGINDRGQAVGNYYTGTRTRGFLYERGQFTYIDYPGAQLTALTDINNAGTITGNFDMPPTYATTAFILTGNRFTPVNPLGISEPQLGGVVSEAWGINDKGVVVGTVYKGDIRTGYSAVPCQGIQHGGAVAP